MTFIPINKRGRILSAAKWAELEQRLKEADARFEDSCNLAKAIDNILDYFKGANADILVVELGDEYVNGRLYLITDKQREYPYLSWRELVEDIRRQPDYYLQ